VLCVRPDLPIAHAASHARRTHARFVVAIDAALRPLGAIGLDDLDRIHQATHATRLVVADVMRPLRLAIPADVNVSVATAALAQSSVDEAVLVGNEGEVLALLRSVDLLGWHARADGYVIGEPGAR
jgi:CBS domain-containing protein